MEVIAVPAGQNTPDGVDWVEVRKLPDGRFQYYASVATSPRDAIFNSGPFASSQAARDAGLVWAEQEGATFVYVAVPDEEE